MKRKDCALLLLVAVATLGPLRAAEAPVDADLLEFLGSVDSEDATWNEYLERTDVRKVATPAPDDAARATPPAGSRSDPAAQPAPDTNQKVGT